MLYILPAAKGIRLTALDFLNSLYLSNFLSENIVFLFGFDGWKFKKN